MNPSRRPLALLGITVAGVALVGCGSSSNSGLQRSALVAKANAICASANTQANAIRQPSSFQNPAVAAAYFDKIEPIAFSSTEQLQKLSPDSSVSADWSAYMTARKNGLSLLQTLDAKAHARDVSGLRDLKRLPTVSAQLAAIASKLGASDCAR
jgi:hypothetical protein